MADLRDLYQEVVVDHSKRPRNFRKMEGPHVTAQGYNPLCGDRVAVHVKLENGHLSDVSFEGSGCAISTASASIMTEAVKGKTAAEAEALFQSFHDLATKGETENAGAPPLGKLEVFSKVSDYPARVKCATLVWHTLHSALQGGEGVISTE
ncbi:MAG TPA: SUF system NifU family Fe-S cluster assembly protein [Terriglobia bacterium]|nr:SUF system NifU family Fe-S cluster assembly protein [Terriglobia bacterium]